jgi:hypothetical protein
LTRRDLLGEEGLPRATSLIQAGEQPGTIFEPVQPPATPGLQIS